MRLLALGSIVVALAGGVLETALDRRAAVADRVDDALLELLATSAGVDLVVATTPFGLWRSFDAVNQKVQGLEAVRRTVAETIDQTTLSTTVQQGLADWDATFIDYQNRFEDVKSKRAALTNIEHYLPMRLRELQVSFPDDVVISAIRSEVLAYLLAPSQEHLHALEVRVAALREVPLPRESGAIAPTALQAVAAEAGRLSDVITLRRGLEQASTDLTRAPLARSAAVVARAHRDVTDAEAQHARLLRFAALGAVVLVGLGLLWRRPRVVV